MKRFSYLQLRYSPEVVFVDTDPQTLENIISLVKAKDPDCKMARELPGQAGFSETGFFGAVIGNWLRSYLCENGWEPFAITNLVFSEPEFLVYHFKFESRS